MYINCMKPRLYSLYRLNKCINHCSCNWELHVSSSKTKFHHNCTYYRGIWVMWRVVVSDNNRSNPSSAATLFLLLRNFWLCSGREKLWNGDLFRFLLGNLFSKRLQFCQTYFLFWHSTLGQFSTGFKNFVAYFSFLKTKVTIIFIPDPVIFRITFSRVVSIIQDDRD